MPTPYRTIKPTYLSVCYHYLKQESGRDLFPRIIGHPVVEFRRHVARLVEKFRYITLADAERFSYEKIGFDDDRVGMLLSFDDGLAEHHLAATILAEAGVKAVFFVPTCVLVECEPANPTIIHYVIAHYGVDGFLKHYRNALEEFGFAKSQHDISFERGWDDPWQVIAKIKSIFKYGFAHPDGRKLLLHIYKDSLLQDFPNAMELMYATRKQIADIVNMGHALGAHSHTHLSIGAADLTPEDFDKEILAPKRILEDMFATEVHTLSYPFGGKRDSWPIAMLDRLSSAYRLAFTVEAKLNTADTPLYDLGRYSSSSRDTADDVETVLAKILNQRNENEFRTTNVT